MAIDIMAAFEEEPPILDFIWPGFLAGSVGALVAPGATGKSFWALEAAMAVACAVPGGDILGLAPASSGRVVYLAAEDPEPALICRVHALGAHLGQAAREAIAERLTLRPIMGKRLNIMDEKHLAHVVDDCAGARLLVARHPQPYPYPRRKRQRANGATCVPAGVHRGPDGGRSTFPSPRL